MKSLIIKTGSTFEELKKSKGDFEDWIMKFRKDKSDFVVNDITKEPLKGIPSEISNVIITGSHSNVTDEEDWQKYLQEFIHKLIQKRIPMLGICYGHQILAATLGGKVADHPIGGEFGIALIQGTREAGDDPLFKDLPDSFIAYVSHGQSVTQLPDKAVPLAFSTAEAFEAVRFSETTWGVQFHPEFDDEIARFYLEFHHQNRLSGVFNNLDSVRYDIRYSQYILYNFLKLFT